MIKNIFYSLILHFILLLTLFFSFKSKIFNHNDNDDIAINLVRIDDNKNSIKKLAPQKKEIIKKEILSPKKEEKPQTKKEEPKPKEEKKKEEKTEKKEPEEEKKKEKKTEKKEPEEKPEEKPKKQIEKKPETKKQRTIKKPEKKLTKPLKKPIKKAKNTEKQLKTAIPQDKNSKKTDINTSNDNIAATKDKNDEVIINEANNLENLNLSTREKLNIQNQLNRCYNRAIKESKTESPILLTITIQIDKNGYITSNIDAIKDQKRYKSDDLDYKNAIDNAKRALILCNPMRNLPADKYDIWQKINLNFGEKSLKTAN